MDARNDLINEISVFLADKAMDARSIVSAKYSCGFSNLLDSSIIVNER